MFNNLNSQFQSPRGNSIASTGAVTPAPFIKSVAKDLMVKLKKSLPSNLKYFWNKSAAV